MNGEERRGVVAKLRESGADLALVVADEKGRALLVLEKSVGQSPYRAVAHPDKRRPVLSAVSVLETAHLCRGELWCDIVAARAIGDNGGVRGERLYNRKVELPQPLPWPSVGHDALARLVEELPIELDMTVGESERCRRVLRLTPSVSDPEGYCRTGDVESCVL